MNQTGNLALVRDGGAETATQRRSRETQERFHVKQAEKLKKEAAAEKRRKEITASKQGVLATKKPRIELVSDPAAIRDLTRIVNEGTIPDTYVRAGQVVIVETPSGATTEDDEPNQVINIVEPDTLNRLLANHTYCFQRVREKLPDGSTEEMPLEVTPPKHVTKAVLSSMRWDKLRGLKAIVTAPTFRTDGTLVQVPGYDDGAQVIYSPTLPLEHIPDLPSEQEVWAAKCFLREQLLHDFPWVGPSRANFLGMLVAPLMQALVGDALIPLCAIDATSPATGKSLLALIMTKTYSGFTRPWVSDNTELRKAITSMLVDNGGAVVCLDNVGKGEVVDQPTLAALLTQKVWSDRLLGVSGSVRVPNNRVWLVTGNSLTIGGDIASRTVLVRLDARLPDPGSRPASRFALGDLEEWLGKPTNRATVLRHLLVLMRYWVANGATRIETPMRTFTPWASATAGFLASIGEEGFMSNSSSLNEVDEEEVEYGAFYSRWHTLFGSQKVTISELRESAVPDEFGVPSKNWEGAFLLRKKDGKVPSSIGLSKMLAGERGRYRGGFRLNGFFDTHIKVWSYSVTPLGEDVPEGAQ